MKHQQKVFKMTHSCIRAMALFVFWGLVWVSPALASVGAQEVPAVESQQILWKVQSPQNTIYLAGSIYVLQKHHYPLPHVFNDTFNESSRVMFEVDLDGLSSPLLQMNMLRKGLYLNGDNLPNVLSTESYATAKAHLTELGLQIEDFHRMKPWMIATTVMALELQKLGFESAYGVDRHFFEKAQEAGKDIQGLETVEFQLNLFDQLPFPVQEQFLLQTLEDLKNLKNQVSDMVRAWKQGNVQELETLLVGMREYPELYQALVVNRNNDWLPHIEQALKEKEPDTVQEVSEIVNAWKQGNVQELETVLVGMREYPELYQALVVNRNNDWLPHIEQALKEKESVFIVVGALHLMGKEGLVAALKEKGYLVQQL